MKEHLEQEQPFYQPNVRGTMSKQTKGLIAAALIIIVGGLLVYQIGGSGGSQSTPEKTVRSFFKAVESRDGEAAVKLLKPDTVPDDKAELNEMIDGFEVNIGKLKVVSIDINDVDIDEDTAKVDYGITVELDGQRDSDVSAFKLVKIDDKWYIDSNIN